VLFEWNVLSKTGFAPPHSGAILAIAGQTAHADLDLHERFSV
jgi:hypothetical protein